MSDMPRSPSGESPDRPAPFEPVAHPLDAQSQALLADLGIAPGETVPEDLTLPPGFPLLARRPQPSSAPRAHVVCAAAPPARRAMQTASFPPVARGATSPRPPGLDSAFRLAERTLPIPVERPAGLR